MAEYDDPLAREKDKWIEALKANGHAPRMDDDIGGLDIFVCDVGVHNGPGCETCYMSWCMHCSGPEDVGPCSSPVIECVAVPAPKKLR